MSHDAFILHHYPESPYSEKIRAMLGYAGVSWKSVQTTPQPPRDSLDPVLEGYRRIPVAQIGADYFCDTRTIVPEIARIAKLPELAIGNASASGQADVDRFDQDIFLAALAAIPIHRMIAAVFFSYGVDGFKFLSDRTALAKAGGLRVGSRKEAKTLWANHLLDLNERVKDGFIGGDRPNAADFSAYHVVWFYKSIMGSIRPQTLSHLRRWARDIRAFGHGDCTQLTASESLDIAKAASPRMLTPPTTAKPLIGASVEVVPSDYARIGTTGVLCSTDNGRYIIARETARSGRIHIHFPQTGFILNERNPD